MTHSIMTRVMIARCRILALLVLGVHGFAGCADGDLVVYRQRSVRALVRSGYMEGGVVHVALRCEPGWDKWSFFELWMGEGGSSSHKGISLHVLELGPAPLSNRAQKLPTPRQVLPSATSLAQFAARRGGGVAFTVRTNRAWQTVSVLGAEGGRTRRSLYEGIGLGLTAAQFWLSTPRDQVWAVIDSHTGKEVRYQPDRDATYPVCIIDEDPASGVLAFSRTNGWSRWALVGDAAVLAESLPHAVPVGNAWTDAGRSLWSNAKYEHSRCRPPSLRADGRRGVRDSCSGCLGEP